MQYRTNSKGYPSYNEGTCLIFYSVFKIIQAHPFILYHGRINQKTSIPNTDESIVEENNLQYVVRNRAGYLSKILVKVKKQNERYSIISNYTSEELKELGYSSTEISNMKTINMYDEVLVKPDLSKVK